MYAYVCAFALEMVVLHFVTLFARQRRDPAPRKYITLDVASTIRPYLSRADLLLSAALRLLPRRGTAEFFARRGQRNACR